MSKLEGAKDGTSTACAQETGVKLLSYFSEESFYGYFTELLGSKTSINTELTNKFLNAST